MENVVRIPYPVLCQKVASALVTAGVSPEMAALESQIMAESDVLGVPSHGVRMLPGLLAALKDGRVTAQPRIQIKRELGATSLVDGGNGPGRPWRAGVHRPACQQALCTTESRGLRRHGTAHASGGRHWTSAVAQAASGFDRCFCNLKVRNQ